MFLFIFSFSSAFCYTFFLLIMMIILSFFFFNDTATTEIYTLSLHDALPIPQCHPAGRGGRSSRPCNCCSRSEEHTSELQSHSDLVCRLLLEKKKKNHLPITSQKNQQENTNLDNNIDQP